MEIIKNNSKGSLDNTDQFDFLKKATKKEVISGLRSDVSMISKITPGVRNENRVNIFINGKFDFSLDVAQVVDFHLKVGQLLTAEKLRELRHASEFGKLYQSALEKALTRPHSVREMRDFLVKKRSKRIVNNRFIVKNQNEPEELKEKYKLRTKKQTIYTDEDIDAVINRLCEKGFVDDYKFAEFFVENRNLKKGESAKKLRLELQKKGVSSSIIDEVLSTSERSDEEEIKKIIAKKSRKYSKEKLIAYLARQGFDYQLARALVQEQDEHP